MTAAVFIAPRRWLWEEGSRLDASCYTSGGFEAQEAITRSGSAWAPLRELAEPSLPPRFARRPVRDASRGVTFLSSSDILLADLVGLPFLSTRATLGLSDLIPRPRTSLVSRSGTIGRVAYVRPEMDGMAVSEHAIRVTPDETAVPSGYLFAFLSSRPAQAMIKQRTYGSVVQHIEPIHIANLPVPLPDDAVQARIHALVETAATARTQAAQLLDRASSYFDRLGGSMPSTHDHARVVGRASRLSLVGRLDAFYHVGWAAEPRFRDGDRLESLAEVSRPGIVKRIWAERGVPFVSGIDAFQVRPSFRERIRRDEALAANAVVTRGQILVQRLGQRYGLVGRPTMTTDRMDGWVATEHLFRVTPRDSSARGRIFSFLRSDAGRRTLVRQSYGTSIPCLNQEGFEELVVPELPAELNASAVRALELREQADHDEERAIREVEEWLG